MWKTGICDRETFARMDAAGLLASRPISCALLRVDSPAGEQDIRRFEQFTRLLDLSGGIFRTTYRNRFEALDRELLPYLEQHFGGMREPLLVCDCAASSCLTTVEWSRVLFPRWPALQLTATDFTMFLVEAAGRRGAYYFEPRGKLLQFVKPPFVISFTRRDSAVFVVNRWLARQAVRDAPRLEDLKEGSGAWRVQRIPLIHPEAAELNRRDPRFQLREHSIFEPLPEPVHVIRSMNILNPGYFSAGQLRMGIHAIRDSLVPGGLWIVGRTIEEDAVPQQRVTLYEKRGDGFIALHRVGGGAEIEAVVSAP